MQKLELKLGLGCCRTIMTEVCNFTYTGEKTKKFFELLCIHFLFQLFSNVGLHMGEFMSVNNLFVLKKYCLWGVIDCASQLSDGAYF